MEEFHFHHGHVCFSLIQSEDELALLHELNQADYTIVYLISGTWDMDLEKQRYYLKPKTLLHKRSEEQWTLYPCTAKPQLFVLGVWGKCSPLHTFFTNDAELYETLSSRPLGTNNICSPKSLYASGASMVIFNLLTFRALQFHEVENQRLIESWCHRLLSSIHLCISDNPQVLTPVTIVEHIKDYIDKHLSEDLSARILGQHFYLNPNYLSDVFKKETNISLRQYIISCRINKANDLIRRGVSLTEAAYQVGYKSYPGFYKAYLQTMGISPIDYQTQIQTNS